MKLEQNQVIIIGVAILVIAIGAIFYMGGGASDRGFSFDTLTNNPTGFFSVSDDIGKTTDPNAFEEVNPFGYQNPFE